MLVGMSEAVSSDIRQEANTALMEVDKGAPAKAAAACALAPQLAAC